MPSSEAGACLRRRREIVANWFAAGYTSEKMLDAGKQIIDATMAAFPKSTTLLSRWRVTATPGATGNLDPDADYVARNAVLAARATWPGRLIVQKNNLATFNPPAPGTDTVFQLLWDSRPDIGGQMLWNCFSDTSYRMNNGVAHSPATILHKSVRCRQGLRDELHRDLSDRCSQSPG